MPSISNTRVPSQELLDRLAAVRLLTLDVDGVLTDGGLYYTDDGVIMRRFNVKDGLGIKRVQAAGIAVALISAGPACGIERRGRDLGIAHVYSGVGDKLAKATMLCGELGYELAEVAHVGDDLTDLPLLAAVGCPLTVADAVPEVREAAVFVTERGGGNGAVREICDLLLAARAR